MRPRRVWLFGDFLLYGALDELGTDVFRKADRNDIPMLTEARLAYLWTEFGEVSEDIADALPRYFEAHLNRDLFACICTDEGRLAGTVFLLVTEKPPSPSFPGGRVVAVLNTNP